MSSSVVKFIHNNKIMEIQDVDPNETLLNYIREKLNKTGTKEGCAEGGCGACTVVLGYLKNNKIFYQSVNACIVFLPTIHGKQLILVEISIETGTELQLPISGIKNIEKIIIQIMSIILMIVG